MRLPFSQAWLFILLARTKALCHKCRLVPVKLLFLAETTQILNRHKACKFLTT